MLSPMMDTILQVGIRALNIVAFDTVVELCCAEVGYVPETVPLGAALGVEGVLIIVGEVFGQDFELVPEFLAAEGGDFGDVEGETGSGVIIG